MVDRAIDKGYLNPSADSSGQTEHFCSARVVMRPGHLTLVDLHVTVVRELSIQAHALKAPTSMIMKMFRYIMAAMRSPRPVLSICSARNRMA